MGKFHSIIPDDKKYDKVRKLMEEDDGPKRGDQEGQGRRMRGGQGRRRKREASRSRQSRQARPSRQAGQAQASQRTQREKSPSIKQRPGISFWILLVIFLIYAIPTTVSLVRSKGRLGDLQQEEANLNYEKESLKEEVAALQDQLKKVDSDEFIRKYAHEQLGMVLPNEIVIEMENGGVSLDENAYKKAQDRADELEKRKEEEAELNQEKNLDGQEENPPVGENDPGDQEQGLPEDQNPDEPAPQGDGDGE